MFVYKSEPSRISSYLGLQDDYSGTLAQKCDAYLPRVGVEIPILFNIPTIGILIQML